MRQVNTGDVSAAHKGIRARVFMDLYSVSGVCYRVFVAGRCWISFILILFVLLLDIRLFTGLYFCVF